MDLIVIAGTHWAGCAGLRQQIVSAEPDLTAAGIHTPSGTASDAGEWHRLPKSIGRRSLFRRTSMFDQQVQRAREAGAEALLLMSEEFETAAVNPQVPAALARHAGESGGRAIVVLLFRHQVDYLNLVFAGRAVAGLHGRRFAEFVKSPEPARQFDYVDVVSRFDVPGVEVRPMALADAVSGEGLATVLAAAGTGPAIATASLDVEKVPDAAKVGLALLARRAVEAGEGRQKGAHVTRETRQLVDRLGSLAGSIGPFWGWTDRLLTEHVPGFDETNRVLQERYGLTPLTWERPERRKKFAISDLGSEAVKQLVDGLAAV